MNNIPLESARAKLDRAKEILRQLETEIQLAESNKAHSGISFDYENATDELVLTARIAYGLFVRYAILAGEVIHQVRSSLEHAVWELLPSPIIGKTGFPVFRVESQADAIAQGMRRYYNQHGVRMIDGINPAAATIIRELQPFGTGYQSDPLFILNELWNRDKHRMLNTCIIMPVGISLLYHFPDDTWKNKIIQVPGDVVYGAELFRERHPGKEVEVMAEVAVTLLVFKDYPIAARQPLLKMLLNLVEFSEKTITELAKTL